LVCCTKKNLAATSIKQAFFSKQLLGLPTQKLLMENYFKAKSKLPIALYVGTRKYFFGTFCLSNAHLHIKLLKEKRKHFENKKSLTTRKSRQ
jgi:hypothetical protein